MTGNPTFLSTRRAVLAGAAALAASAAVPRFAQAQTAEPVRLGFQLHRTGIGAAYGRWYERTADAALKVVNEAGGIAGRPVEILFEDDATDPRRGAEVVEKLVSQAKVDLIFGTLFSHVVIGSAARAGELKVPYLVCSEGYHVASGKLNRWVLQPGITDVRAQVTAMAPFVTQNLGRKVTMIFPDYAFGHDHRDFFSAAVEAQGGEVLARIAIPPTETNFTRYFPRIPRETEVIYHVMVGPSVLTFVKELGEFYGSGPRPKLFGFIDSLEAVDVASPGLEFLEGAHFWEGHCRMLQPDASEAERFYRAAVGVDDRGAAVEDPKNVSCYGHMFSVWETLFTIKAGMETCGWRGPQDRQAFVEAIEAMTDLPAGRERPQGAKRFDARLHQAFGHQYISKLEGGRLIRVHRTAIEDGLYPSDVDYRSMSF